MIRLERVSKSYAVPGGRHVILDDVSFELPPLSRVGIFGVNGAGKSALLRLIAGSEMPDRGRIVREGRISFPVGFTGTFHPHLSARENVAFLARVYGMNHDEVSAGSRSSPSSTATSTCRWAPIRPACSPASPWPPASPSISTSTWWTR